VANGLLESYMLNGLNYTFTLGGTLEDYTTGHFNQTFNVI